MKKIGITAALVFGIVIFQSTIISTSVSAQEKPLRRPGIMGPWSVSAGTAHPACLKALNKVRQPGQVFNPEETKQILDAAGIDINYCHKR